MRLSSLIMPAVAVLAVSACGGSGGSPAAPPPVSSPSAVPTAAPPPPPIPGYSSTCSAIGYGHSGGACDSGVESAFLPDVENAIDTLVSKKPEIFDFRSPAADGGIRIVDKEAYYQGVVDLLGAKGLCAAPSFGAVTLLVKRTNEFSEAFVILSPRDSVRKGPSVFATRCSPAEFPLTADEAISYVRVAFFGIECPAGINPPAPPLGRLPVVCTGHLTATPKDVGGRNVPDFIHGPDIAWELRSGEGRVAPRPVEVPFNYALVGRSVGNFSFCATVKGVTGCLDGRVIPVQ
jgi:hypothetical protein